MILVFQSLFNFGVRGLYVLGYNHIPYFNCPASTKCRGCDAGKFFGISIFEFETDILIIEGTGLGPENCKPLWDKVVRQGTGQRKTWKEKAGH